MLNNICIDIFIIYYSFKYENMIMHDMLFFSGNGYIHVQMLWTVIKIIVHDTGITHIHAKCNTLT